MEILRRHIAATTENIARSLLGIELKPCESGPGKGPCFADQGEGSYHGFVEISGAWQGRVLIGCNGEFAREIAAVMFRSHLIGDLEFEEPTDFSSLKSRITLEDMHDTLIELANIIGGNIKSIISEATTGLACTLSIPERVDEKQLFEISRNSTEVCSVHYKHADHWLAVTLLSV